MSGNWENFEAALDKLVDQYVEDRETAREAERRLQQRSQGLREMFSSVDRDDSDDDPFA